MPNKAALIILLLCFGCNTQSQVFPVYEKGKILPEVVAGNDLDAAVALLVNTFEEVTGYRPAIGSAVTDTKPLIVLEIYKEKKGAAFSLYQKKNKLVIQGESPEAVEKGIRYFFSSYAGYSMPGAYKSRMETINIPLGLSYHSELTFEYREPYFRDNFNEGFRKWNNTHTLEETWALWGHNISRAITATPAMMATVDGQHNDEQFCFSSPELQAALETYVSDRIGDTANKFMIMPNDNDLVCTCSLCKKAGNTNGNASPAVFGLLNRLAAKFPRQEFFSTAYVTTQTPPSFRLAPNAGVMISTMAFPKGVVIEKSGKKEMVDKTFENWKKITDRIYLWDYAVNYDNYFEAYPTVSIAQQNLKYYKTLGVTGVFMHGSEERFSAFDDLKCYLYAQLLWDVNINIKEYTERFFTTKYPVTGKALAAYYSEIEQTAFDSPRQLDIYGGISQAKRKYLDVNKLTTLYDTLQAKAKSITGNEAADLKPILASLAFNKLELQRIGGIIGYNDAATRELIGKLRSFTAVSKISVYNESNYTIGTYLSQWESEILKYPYKNLLYGKVVKFAETPDEDYSDPKILTDSAIGFNDYYNNWLLSTANAFSVTVDAQEVATAKVVEISFLNDNKHRIYLPKKVVITVGKRTYEKELPMLNGNTVSKYKVSIPVEILPTDTVIAIQAIKQDDFAKRSTACDELFFK